MPNSTPASTRLFDAYLFIDWSANSRPKRGKDSIWIAEGSWASDKVLSHRQKDDFVLNQTINVSTRGEATEGLHERLSSHLAEGQRTLICFDFSYGFPSGPFRDSIGKNFNAIGDRLTALISDNALNENNRFEVASQLNKEIGRATQHSPFWGRPSTVNDKVSFNLPQKKPAFWSQTDPQEYRIVERRMRASGKRVFSAWQLLGHGSVGSQMLVGIPHLNSLRNSESLHAHSKIWPFDTGWTNEFDSATKIVHAEFWPGILPTSPSTHSIRDAAQVENAVHWASRLDERGQLAPLFDPMSQEDPDRNEARDEGWILGFTCRQ
ncbi:MAG: hypothetical protein QF516_06615 [Pirellulaceae bacterium]|nr:hypothetical protein [Pirellulaceae bacterium]